MAPHISHISVRVFENHGRPAGTVPIHGISAALWNYGIVKYNFCSLRARTHWKFRRFLCLARIRIFTTTVINNPAGKVKINILGKSYGRIFTAGYIKIASVPLASSVMLSCHVICSVITVSAWSRNIIAMILRNRTVMAWDFHRQFDIFPLMWFGKQIDLAVRTVWIRLWSIELNVDIRQIDIQIFDRVRFQFVLIKNKRRTFAFVTSVIVTGIKLTAVDII